MLASYMLRAGRAFSLGPRLSKGSCRDGEIIGRRFCPKAILFVSRSGMIVAIAGRLYTVNALCVTAQRMTIIGKVSQPVQTAARIRPFSM